MTKIAMHHPSEQHGLVLGEPKVERRLYLTSNTEEPATHVRKNGLTENYLKTNRTRNQR